MQLARKNLQLVLVLLFCVGMTGSVAPVRGAEAPAPAPLKERVGFLQDLLPNAWQKRPNVRFNVFTELTPEGRKRPEPSPAKPLYYTAPPGTLAQPGWLPAAGEKAPPWEELQESMRAALAGNGYLPVDAAHPRPDVLIAFTYGSHGTDLAALAVSNGEPLFPPPVTAEELMPWIFGDPKALEDVIDRARFIGGERVAQALVGALKEEVSNAHQNAVLARLPPPPGSDPPPSLPLSPESGAPFVILLQSTGTEPTRNVLELAFHTCYFVTATAYDFSGVEKKQKIPLWQTRMTVEAQGVDLREVLKPLIINTGPFLGRETPEAVTVQKRLDREGNVQIGTAEVVRDPAAIAPTPPAPAIKP